MSIEICIIKRGTDKDRININGFIDVARVGDAFSMETFEAPIKPKEVWLGDRRAVDLGTGSDGVSEQQAEITLKLKQKYLTVTVRGA